MVRFHDELKTHDLTLKQIAEKADVPFSKVYMFRSGAFALIPEEVQIKIVHVLRALTNHPYQLSDFVAHPPLPPDIPLATAVVIPLGARGGRNSLPLVEELKRNGTGIETWAMMTQRSHRPKVQQDTQNGTQ